MTKKHAFRTFDMIVLKEGRQKAVLNRHPWVFSGAIQAVKGNPLPGRPVVVVDSERRPLALAAFSPVSQIRARVWTFLDDNTQELPTVDEALFEKKISIAWAGRARLWSEMARNMHSGNVDSVPAIRVINAEGDNMPGVVVDRYGSYLVVQLNSAGAHHHRHEIINALQKVLSADGSVLAGVVDRSDADARKLEGLPTESDVGFGNVPADMVIREGSRLFSVSLESGHKTGFYIDQRDNREKFQRFVPPGSSVLNCFAFTGGFGISALHAHASTVINVESSAPASEIGKRNCELNRQHSSTSQPMHSSIFAHQPEKV